MMEEEARRSDLRRVLRLGDSIAVIIGIIIGSGIFFTPTTIAQSVAHGPSILFLWMIGGVAALCGALTFAELASYWPRTGGMYVFIRECYGRLPSFLFGWAQLLIVRPAAVAAISVIFAKYVAFFLPTSKTGIKLIAIVGILCVSIVNYLGVRFSSLVINTLTTFKILSLLFIGFAAIFLFDGTSGFNFSYQPEVTSSNWLIYFAGALIGIFWTYDGWSELTTVAGEVKNPHVTIPRALLLASVGVIFLYVLVNFSFIHVLGIEAIQQSEHVASDMMSRVIGRWGGSLIAIMVIVSTLGALNGTTLTGPRIYFAMAVDGVFFSWARQVHPEFRSPTTAIGVQAALSIPLVITWSFDQLATYFVYVSLLFYALCTSSIFIVRRKKLHLKEGSYRIRFYPWIPIFFLIVATGVLAHAIWNSPVQAMVGTGILCLGIPIYFLWQMQKKGAEVS